MTQLQILKLAYNGALEIWSRQYDRAKARPNDELAQARFKTADKDLNEIRAMLIAEEEKEGTK